MAISKISDVNAVSYPGAVLQVVNAIYGTQVSIASGTMTATGLTATITPKFATSKILVLTDIQGVYSSGAISGSNYSLYKNGSLLVKLADVAGYINSASGDVGSVSSNYLDSPATTSATTYAIYFNRSIGTAAMYMNEGGGCSSGITLMEIAA